MGSGNPRSRAMSPHRMLATRCRFLRIMPQLLRSGEEYALPFGRLAAHLFTSVHKHAQTVCHECAPRPPLEVSWALGDIEGGRPRPRGPVRAIMVFVVSEDCI